MAGFALAYRFIEPAPPNHLRIAAGALGGGYDQYAEKLKATLARDRITLDVLPTAGSLQNLTLLDAPRSRVDLALVQGGTGNRDAMPTLRSLASLYYEPIWLFVRGAPPDRLSALKGKRIAVGADDSGTREVAAELLAASGVDNDNAVFALGGKDAAALVSRDSLHPALIDLMIEATRGISGSGDEFAAPEEFPSAKHLDFPLTSEAKRALANGPNFLRRYLPFRAAALVERMWMLIFPLLTLMIPLMRMAPPTYRWQVRRRILNQYREPKRIEVSARDIRRPEARELALKALDRLQADTGRLPILIDFVEDLYHLRQHIDFVKRML